jgi:hypothetical protein
MKKISKLFLFMLVLGFVLQTFVYSLDLDRWRIYTQDYFTIAINEKNSEAETKINPHFNLKYDDGALQNGAGDYGSEFNAEKIKFDEINFKTKKSNFREQKKIVKWKWGTPIWGWVELSDTETMSDKIVTFKKGYDDADPVKSNIESYHLKWERYQGYRTWFTLAWDGVYPIHNAASTKTIVAYISGGDLYGKITGPGQNGITETSEITFVEFEDAVEFEYNASSDWCAYDWAYYITYPLMGTQIKFDLSKMYGINVGSIFKAPDKIRFLLYRKYKANPWRLVSAFELTDSTNGIFRHYDQITKMTTLIGDGTNSFPTGKDNPPLYASSGTTSTEITAITSDAAIFDRIAYGPDENAARLSTGYASSSYVPQHYTIPLVSNTGESISMATNASGYDNPGNYVYKYRIDVSYDDGSTWNIWKNGLRNLVAETDANDPAKKQINGFGLGNLYLFFTDTQTDGDADDDPKP